MNVDEHYEEMEQARVTMQQLIGEMGDPVGAPLHAVLQSALRLRLRLLAALERRQEKGYPDYMPEEEVHSLGFDSYLLALAALAMSAPALQTLGVHNGDIVFALRHLVQWSSIHTEQDI